MCETKAFNHQVQSLSSSPRPPTHNHFLQHLWLSLPKCKCKSSMPASAKFEGIDWGREAVRKAAAAGVSAAAELKAGEVHVETFGDGGRYLLIQEAKASSQVPRWT